MIINTRQNDIQVIGDIKEFKTSIDPKNIEFITTLLSSNLYSAPEQSFIREITSNAWDSHVEAGTTDTPVIIRFKQNATYTWSISIRDFGTGLSEERFKNIFCNIGSSTKRESNDYIGGFGIGRFSALACSDTVYITSFYQGICRKYVMVKSGNTITTNLLSTAPTDEKNGVEVTITNIASSKLFEFKNALKYIIFFPNVYIDGIDTKLNDVQIKSYKYFKAASQVTDFKLLLGNVLYPCNISMVSNDCRDFLRVIGYSGVVLSFNIGELDMTPNRESLIYNSKTIEAINRKALLARDEIDELVKKCLDKDYDDLYQYHLVSSKSIYYDPINNTAGSEILLSEGVWVDGSIINATFKGEEIDIDGLHYISSFFHANMPNIKGRFHNGKFYTDKHGYGTTKLRLPSCKYILILKGNGRLTQDLKDWLFQHYNQYTILTEFTKSDFWSYIQNEVCSMEFRHYKDRDKLIDYMYDYIMNTAVFFDPENDPDFKKYKEESKEARKKLGQKKLDTIRLNVFCNGYYSARTEEFKSIEQSIKRLKDYHRGAIFISRDEFDVWKPIAAIKNYALVVARKEVRDAFEKIKPSFYIDKLHLLENDKAFIRYNTILSVFDCNNIPAIFRNNEMYRMIPQDLCKIFKSIVTDYNKASEEYSLRSLIKSQCTKIDNYTLYYCNKLKDISSKYESVCREIGVNINGRDDLLGDIVATIVKNRKLYRINYHAYMRIKKNNLINALCKK